MTLLVPIGLFGWPLLSILLFLRYSPPKAAAIVTIGGFLFLPVALYDIPGFPGYGKDTAIALGLLLGGLCHERRISPSFRMTKFDIPFFVWCFVSPVITSLSNGLGLYDGIAGIFSNCITWGVFYWAGRRFFWHPESLRILTKGLIFGGLLYIPLILFELRMSPQLSNILYGFMPHSFLQHVRYGGYRPIVFMNHGLMVSFWMSAASLAAFWLWKSKTIKTIKGIPISFAFFILAGATVLCKSMNGIVFLLLGVISCFCTLRIRSTAKLRWFLLFIPVYIVVRLANFITIQDIQTLALKLFDIDRVNSLTVRLLQEYLFGARALQHPLLGWGGFGRGWPIDPETGEHLIQMVDSLWIILISTYGILGLFSVFSGMGVGAWFVFTYFRHKKKSELLSLPNNSIDAIILSLVVTFFLCDSLLNAMATPVYILYAGAINNYILVTRRKPIEAIDPASKLNLASSESTLLPCEM